MGGVGSGGRNRLSDEEKRARGTYRNNTSDSAWDQKQAAKIITGHFLSRVPEPQMMLDKIGLAKYKEFAEMLLNGGKLTKVTCDDVERYALLWQQAYARSAEGKAVPNAWINKMDSIAIRLRIADEAPAISNPTQKSKFEGVGFANSRHSTFELLPFATAGSKK